MGYFLPRFVFGLWTPLNCWVLFTWERCPSAVQMTSVIVEFRIGWPAAMKAVWTMVDNISNLNANFTSFMR